MAKQLLDAVNEILKRVNINAGNASALTSLTDSARQHNIDISVQVVNEGMDELYTACGKELPNQLASSTITMATGVREYALAVDLITLMFPLTDRANTQWMYKFEGSYEDFLAEDPQQIYTGRSTLAMISPITNQLRMIWAPDAPTNGSVYTYQYKRDTVLVNATDTIPFNNEVFRSMVPAWAQLYKREMRNEFDQALFVQAIGRASRAITEYNARTDYDPR